MRSRFDEQLEKLNRELIRMGALCEEAIAAVAQALNRGTPELRAKIAETDGEIDRMEKDIETMCLRLLLQQQPVAGDLRLISAALKMITDMERIGDQAADIGEIIGYLKGRLAAECGFIDQMASVTMEMVKQSVDAFVKRDIQLAQRVVDRDDQVDELFDRVKATVIEKIAAAPEDGEYAIDLMMIAKYFERIGDHAVNIAEWVIFSVTGIHKGADEL